MPQIKKVVFPVDFSKRCEGTAHVVEALSVRFQPEILMVHVLAPLHYEAMSLEVSGPALADLIASREADARRRLESFLKDEMAAFHVRRELLEGEPARMIVEYAKQENADLIVMPTHGYGAFRRFILGSVTAKVLHDADCPVFTGVHLADAPAPEKIRIEKVVVALDLSDSTDQVLQWAAFLAQAVGARLVFTHVVPSIEGETGEVFDPDWRETFAAPARKRIQELMVQHGLRGDIVIDWGEASKQVCEVAEAEGADLLVIGRSHSERPLGRLRTHAYAIIRMAPCPVLSV
jgi:nucleotide-binding universal stress UspA family protein